MAQVKSYKEHLRENIKNWEAALGYIRECAKDGDPDVLLLAVRDVWEFAAYHQRKADADVAIRRNFSNVAEAIQSCPLVGSERTS